MYNYKCMLINISISFGAAKEFGQKIRVDRDGKFSILECTRICWRANIDRAQEADYVLGVDMKDNGKILGVFKPTKWYIVNPAQCESYLKTMDPECLNKCNAKPQHPCGRIAFEGKEAEDQIKKLYLHKSISDIFPNIKMNQNPVRYNFK